MTELQLKMAAIPSPSPVHSLGTRLNDLLLNEKYTDCSFNIDNNIIKCHKLILSSASPVFEAMFYGPLAEKSMIDIPDINYDVFSIMLNFIYTDNLIIETTTTTTSSNGSNSDKENSNNNNIDYDILIELYYCSEKYLINDLMLKLLNLIQKSLRYTNILQALDLAVQLNLKSIIKICMNFLNDCCLNNNNFLQILNNKSTVINTNNNISKNCLNLILNDKYIMNSSNSNINYSTNDKNLNLILLIKKWYLNECNFLNLDYSDNKNLQAIFKDINISDDILNDIVNLNKLNLKELSFILNNNNNNCSNNNNNKLSWITCQRTYYKAVKPFIINYDNLGFNTNITCDRYIIIKSLSINSKMIPIIPYLQEKYTENLYIQIISANDNETLVYDQKSIILNVEYNSNVNIAFDRSIILAPDSLYKIKIIWDHASIGSEYPRNIFSPSENRNFCKLDFDSNFDGSILNGIKYAILS